MQFFGFSTKIDSTSSISSFVVVLKLASGATEIHQNNGNGFPVQDTIMLQSPQSCVSAASDLTVVAAVSLSSDSNPAPLYLCVV